MKVYFFDCITGVYQGEGFEDERVIDLIEGITILAPPPYCKGEIPVYNSESSTWTVTAIGARTPLDLIPGETEIRAASSAGPGPEGTPLPTALRSA